MKNLLIIISFLSLSLQGQTTLPPDTSFERAYGGVNFDEGRDVKEYFDKGLIIAGTTSSFGQGNTSLYLVKTDPMGIFQWSKNYGGTGNDWGRAIEMSPDSGFLITGYTNSYGDNSYNGYYVKTDKVGNLLWEKHLDGSDWDFLYASDLLPDSGYVLCGESYTYTNGGADAWVVRIDKNGDTLWTKHFGGAGDDIFNGVEYLNNKIYLTGKYTEASGDGVGYLLKIDMQGNQINDYKYSISTSEDEYFNGIDVMSNNTLMLTGAIKSVLDPNKTKYLMLHIDTSLVFLGNNVGSSYTDLKIFNKTIQWTNGDYIAVGQYIGTGGGWGGTEMFVDHQAPGFIWQGSTTYGKYGDDYGYSGITRTDGGFAYVGSTTSHGAGAEDVYVVILKNLPVIQAPYISLVAYKDTLGLWIVTNHNSLEGSSQLKVWPNPTSDQCFFEITGASKDEMVNFQLFDMLGRELTELSTSFKGKLMFSKSDIPSGCYYYRITGHSANYSGKVIFH